MVKLVPRHGAPTIHFQLTEAVPMLAAKGDHVMAWLEEGRLLIMTEEEVQIAYDVVLNGAGAKWTEHRRARGNGSFYYTDTMRPVSAARWRTWWRCTAPRVAGAMSGPAPRW
jgi:hypothetical protein